MAYVSLGMSDQEKRIIEEQFSPILKDVFLEKLEDVVDLQSIRTFESAKNRECISFDAVVHNLGLEDVL